MKKNTKKSSPNTKLPKEQVTALLSVLQERFEKHMDRHKGLKWSEVEARLEKAPAGLWSLNEMEATGGEPDVIAYEKDGDKYLFVDCSPESPKGRRSVCYDPDALESRKQHKPAHSALGMAEEMGVSLLDEDGYRRLQDVGRFDTKTSSWLLTPDSVRERGGAIFGDWRYGRVFIYHNGAESYYAARGFRGALWV